MATVRPLTPRDATAALALAGRHPVENVLALAKMRTSGLEPAIMGHDMLGAFDFRGRLIGLLSNANSINPVELADDAIPAFARYLGGVRRAGSIVGVRGMALGLWEELARRFPDIWGRPRQVRQTQYLLALDHDPRVAGDPRVTPVPAAVTEAYVGAAIAMYTEELGQPPSDAQGGYRHHVEGLIQRGEAFCAWEGGRVVFKADVSVHSGDVCQVGGVWLHPDYRGFGLSTALMAAVVTLCRRRWPIVSLYVNDYNARALAVYRNLGFGLVNRFATVLW